MLNPSSTAWALYPAKSFKPVFVSEAALRLFELESIDAAEEFTKRQLPEQLKHYIENHGVPSLTYGQQVWSITNQGVTYLAAIVPAPGRTRAIQSEFWVAYLVAKDSDYEDLSSKPLVRFLEQERSSLARELHDHLGQELTIQKLSIENLLEEVSHTSDPSCDRVLALVKEVKAQNQKTIQAFRDGIQGLRKGTPAGKNIIEALDSLVKRFSRHLGIHGAFRIRNIVGAPHPEISLVLYRCAQELLNNMARHAHAQNFWVELQQRKEGYVLKVQDDGVGFRNSKGKGKSEPLITVRERLAIFNGSVRVSTYPKVAGSLISVTVPQTKGGFN